MTDDERRRMRRREQRRRKRRNALIVKCVILVLLVAVLIGAIWYLTSGETSRHTQTGTPTTAQSSTVSGSSSVSSSSSSGNDGSEEPGSPDETPSPSTERDGIIAEAALMATQYDYDGAIELLYTIEDYEYDAEIITLLADYETERSNLVATSPSSVTHIFFHSLVVDPSRAFSLTGNSSWDSLTPGFCQWMTTIYEFNQIIQQMYDRGYVLVSIYDIVEETVDEDGTVHVTGKNVYLPQGKTPFILSLDDLSYYHAYDDRGIASKMVLDDEGKPVCEYYDADGNLYVGAYDAVPILDEFLEEHPDFSYKGAKGTIALTGYNGILGYRTDFTYRDGAASDIIQSDQLAWLAAHPDFDWEQERADAAVVAQALLDDGWTFACHTWGHIHIDSVSQERVETDTGYWLENVAPLIGGSDIIVFAHGADMTAWNVDYTESEKYLYLKSQGFNLYCNVDSSQYFVQIRDGYLRMGRRNLDGYRLWMDLYGSSDKLGDLIDPASVIDPERPTDADLYAL